MSSIFRPYSELADAAVRRRDLPHWESAGATYFITFRLADALPAGVVRQFESSLAAWLKAHGISHRKQVTRLPEPVQKEFRQLFTAREEQWLDAGQGSCALRDPQCRRHVVETLHAFDGVRYSLDHWVIMPNHVHLMMQPKDEWSVGDIAASWKKFSARRINALRKQSGNFWQSETFDHIVRDRDQLDRIRKYIGDNPRKARLKVGEYALGKGTGVL